VYQCLGLNGSCIATVEASQGDRLTDVVDADLIRLIEVGNGAGYFENAVVGTHREAETLHRAQQQLMAGRIRGCVALELTAGQSAVGGALTIELTSAALLDSLAYLQATLFAIDVALE
jgi:hypothetical protein